MFLFIRVSKIWWVLTCAFTNEHVILIMMQEEIQLKGNYMILLQCLLHTLTLPQEESHFVPSIEIFLFSSFETKYWWWVHQIAWSKTIQCSWIQFCLKFQSLWKLFTKYSDRFQLATINLSIPFTSVRSIFMSFVPFWLKLLFKVIKIL